MKFFLEPFVPGKGRTVFSHIILFLIPLIFGCEGARGKKTRPAKRVMIAECEAKLVDVPFPLGAYPRELSLENNSKEVGGSAVTFSLNISVAQMFDFYKKEMERIGWKEKFVLEGEEKSILIFERPRKICVVLVRSARRGCEVDIFIN